MAKLRPEDGSIASTLRRCAHDIEFFNRAIRFANRDKRPHSRGAIRPSYWLCKTLSIREGAGKAGWPHAPGAPAQKKFARAREPQVQAVTTGLPCAVGYGLYELSSVNHPVCHRRPRDAQGIIANLAPDLGAPGPHDFAVRKVAARQSAPPRPPHPRLTCRDDRDTPLRERGGMSEAYD